MRTAAFPIFSADGSIRAPARTLVLQPCTWLPNSTRRADELVRWNRSRPQGLPESHREGPVPLFAEYMKPTANAHFVSDTQALLLPL